MCDACKVCVRVLHTMLVIYGKGEGKGHEGQEGE